MRWLRLWWPALVWALLISAFSTAAFRSENTSRIIIPILRWLLPHSSPETLDLLHHLIRKCAHVVEYFILSLLVLRGIRAGRNETRLGRALVAVAIVACYAALDEYHQSFVPGRGAAVADVLLDTAGGIAAQIVAALFILWGDVRERHRKTKSES